MFFLNQHHEIELRVLALIILVVMIMPNEKEASLLADKYFVYISFHPQATMIHISTFIELQRSDFIFASEQNNCSEYMSDLDKFNIILWFR